MKNIDIICLVYFWGKKEPQQITAEYYEKYFDKIWYWKFSDGTIIECDRVRMIVSGKKEEMESYQKRRKGKMVMSELIGMTANHQLDEDDNPAGGMTYGTGYAIIWQNGPLGQGENRKEPNGAQVEDVIAAAIDRLEFFQRSKFACDYNKIAITCLYTALESLARRTVDRVFRGVEGEYRE